MISMNKEFSLEMFQNVLNRLKDKDHFFVSEAHLQTEFIIEAAKMYKDFKYYPELAPSNLPAEYEADFGSKAVFFDLIIKCKNQTVLVEFKYLTKEYDETVNGFRIALKNQSAQAIRRYDCWKDISRIETCTINDEIEVDYGYFILITNDPSYWKKPKKSNTIDSAFRIHSGHHKAGNKKWREDTSKGTIGNRSHVIKIQKGYTFQYEPFYDKFQLLLVPIDKK